MAGIYIHIPYCKKACHYCDFHFSTSLASKAELIKCIIQEISVRKNFFSPEERIQTIYFGGGTPSLLGADEIQSILKSIADVFEIDPDPEITMECNPDDLDDRYLNSIRAVGINRLSIGVQSFQDDHLKMMNRAHDSADAVRSIQSAKRAGFNNITIDLMYGMPHSSMQEWKENIQQAINLDVQHISAYCLTVEERTPLHKMVAEGKINVPGDEDSADQFMLLVELLQSNGFIHYEISNFGKEGFFSRHNTAYWKHIPYLGVGPSAHSFNGNQRFWNLSNNHGYIKAIKEWSPFYDQETLSVNERINDMIMTRLRTMWGLDLNTIYSEMTPVQINEFSSEMNKYLTSGHLIKGDNIISLSMKGKLIADRIISDLFII